MPRTGVLNYNVCLSLSIKSICWDKVKSTYRTVCLKPNCLMTLMARALPSPLETGEAAPMLGSPLWVLLLVRETPLTTKLICLLKVHFEYWKLPAGSDLWIHRLRSLRPRTNKFLIMCSVANL